MPYIPHTEGDVRAMLDVIGVDSVEALFDEIPPALRAGKLTSVPEGASEMEVLRIMSDRAQKDAGALCFIGAGAYEHHVPAAVWDLAGRGEFMTAYTPYQAEASQGTLQLIYEYQSMIAHLSAMEVANASLYDGASALAEAVLMAIRANRGSKSRKVLMPLTVNPAYREVTHNITHNQAVELIEVPMDQAQGITDLSALETYAGADIAALVIAQPNFFGRLEDIDALTHWAHEHNMLVIAVVNPTSLALLRPPGEWGESGADIVVGEGQPLGIPLSSGGPYFGFMCCKQAIVRQMPGRIIGRTVDLEGKEGFALTLQAREQHIRRSKATSNICTNQGWAVTAATIYLSLLGAEGLQRVAKACHANLQYLHAKLVALEGVVARFEGPCFHETAIDLPFPAAQILPLMAERGILAGYNLGKKYSGMEDVILVCTTETKTQADLDLFVETLKSIINELGTNQHADI